MSLNQKPAIDLPAHLLFHFSFSSSSFQKGSAMNSKSFFFVPAILIAFAAGPVDAVELRVLKPDGSPANDAKLYRSHLTSGGEGYGMESMMMGGYGESDDEMMDMDMGGDMEMGMGYEMEMGDMYMDMGMESGYDDMEMDSVGDKSASGRPVLTFLDGTLIDPNGQPSHDRFDADQDGRMDLGAGMLRRSRGVSVHYRPALVVHDSGVTFVPAGTRFSSTTRLRSGGRLSVDIPSGVDAGKHKVLVCWQNGFAYPSLNTYAKEMGPSKPLGRGVDVDDWRFSPRFRLYQTAEFGEEINVPPGELRVTIIPKDSIGEDRSKLTSPELFELLTRGGPSTIVLTGGSNQQLQRVHFPALRSLQCRIPERPEPSLPDWGDVLQDRYQIEPFRRFAYGDTSMLSSPEAKDVATRQAAVEFLNRSRRERGEFQTVRAGVRTGNQHVRFDLLRPGWYIINRYDHDGIETRGIPIVEWEHRGDVATAFLSSDGIKGVDGAFQLLVSEQGVTTFEPDRPAKSNVQANADDRKNDADKLRIVQSLRRELDSTIKRLLQQRSRLVTLERKLIGTQQDPFGQDPFGSQDDDPFGGTPSQQADPFGGAPTPQADPFGGSPTPQNDPFSDGSAADSSNPFDRAPGDADADPFG